MGGSGVRMNTSEKGIRHTKTVFVLQHVHEMVDGSEDIKFIGVYSTNENAQKAVNRLRLESGFDRAPEGFCIDDYEVDKDHWTEGYVTL